MEPGLCLRRPPKLSSDRFAMNHLSILTACSVCRPSVESGMADAANGAVWVMLGALSLVLGCFLAIAIPFIMKQRAAAKWRAARAAASCAA